MLRLLVTLEQAEADALFLWAFAELCNPRDLIRLALRKELRERGLLDDSERDEQQNRGEVND